MKTVTTEELEGLRTLHQKFNETKLNIADAELLKRKLFIDLDNLSKEYQELEALLLENYGKVSVNLQTGEINDQD
jgi:hypothetical protein